IRVLTLKASLDRKANLRFTFDVGNINDHEDKHEALSYTLGVPVFSQKLYHENAPGYLKITSNLKDALTKLRQPTPDRMIWVDAVCINQQNNHEKNFQIPMMRDIYKKARGVLTWLVQGNKDVKNDFDRLSKLSRATLVNERGAHRRASERVASLDYFSRRWIIQELVLNHEVTLPYGSASISWIRFQTAFRSVQQAVKAIEDTSSINVVSRIITPWSFWSKVYMLPGWNTSDADRYHNRRGSSRHRNRTISEPLAQKLGVFDLLSTFESSQCGDPLDILYTLLTLTTDMRATGISVHQICTSGIVREQGVGHPPSSFGPPAVARVLQCKIPFLGPRLA
ncbi:HET-domain-containing protein, partial [Bimuria novae-zelandiae CBS 107.79]